MTDHTYSTDVSPARRIHTTAWYSLGMIATIDKAGRVVVPKEIRQKLGFVPGDVEITVQGNQALIQQTGVGLQEIDGHLVLPLGGPQMTPDELRDLRLADQR